MTWRDPIDGVQIGAVQVLSRQDRQYDAVDHTHVAKQEPTGLCMNLKACDVGERASYHQNPSPWKQCLKDAICAANAPHIDALRKICRVRVAKLHSIGERQGHQPQREALRLTNRG